jgi:hypothetical protein
MRLSEYFENAHGRGVIATADARGNVGTAIYGRPHVINEKTIAFIMADRLMHKNLKTNPHASYLFMESGEQYAGKRLYLTKIKEVKDPELINEMQRERKRPAYMAAREPAGYVVYFKINKVLPLIGEKKGAK